MIILQAYKTSWGLKVPGTERGKLLFKLADLVEKHMDELAALDTLNVGAHISWQLFRFLRTDLNDS